MWGNTPRQSRNTRAILSRDVSRKLPELRDICVDLRFACLLLTFALLRLCVRFSWVLGSAFLAQVSRNLDVAVGRFGVGADAVRRLEQLTSDLRVDTWYGRV